MRPRIQDEFTALPISRQRKYQLRMQRDRRCTECGEAAVEGSRCLKHLVKARERQRKKRGLKRRYFGTLSYKLQSEIEIVGSDRFSNQVHEALLLLKTKAPDAYDIVTNYVGRIQQGSHSGM